MGDRKAAEEIYRIAEQAAKDKTYPANANQAFNNFVAAAYVDPTWGQAHYQNGNNLTDLEKTKAAVACYRRALECDQTDENKAKTLSNLGGALHALGETEEALECLLASVDLDPRIPQTWVHLSICHYIQGATETSVSCALKAYELEPTDPAYETALAFSYMHNRQFVEGLHHFEARFRWKLHHFLSFPFTRWRGEKDKTIFVCADQGLGDTLSFARFLPLASSHAKYVHLAVQPALVSVLDYALMKYPNINIMPLGQPFPAYDHWTTFVSLPTAMKLTEDEIVNTPQLDPKIPAGRKDWKVPDRKLHVGIAWAGSTLNPINHHRSIPFEKFLDLYRVPGIQLYGIQVDERKKDLIDYGASPIVRDLSGYVDSVGSTVGIMKNLDLVISCESAVPHIAAMADTECWVPYSRLGVDFRIGILGDKAIWAPRTRYFKQDRSDNWTKPFDDMIAELHKRLEQRKKAA